MSRRRLGALLLPAVLMPRPVLGAWTEPPGEGLAIITLEGAGSHGQGGHRRKAELRLWSAYGLDAGVTLLGQAMVKQMEPGRARPAAVMLGSRLRLFQGVDWVVSAELRGSLGDLGQFGVGASERAGVEGTGSFGRAVDWLGWTGFSVTELGLHQPAGAGTRRLLVGQTFGVDLAPDWQVISETRVEQAMRATGATEWRGQISARLIVEPGLAIQAGPYLRLHSEAGLVTERELGGFLGLWLSY